MITKHIYNKTVYVMTAAKCVPWFRLVVETLPGYSSSNQSDFSNSDTKMV